MAEMIRYWLHWPSAAAACSSAAASWLLGEVLLVAGFEGRLVSPKSVPRPSRIFSLFDLRDEIGILDDSIRAEALIVADQNDLG